MLLPRCAVLASGAKREHGAGFWTGSPRTMSQSKAILSCLPQVFHSDEISTQVWATFPSVGSGPLPPSRVVQFPKVQVPRSQPRDNLAS